jgi:hypothetical protein
VRFDREFAHSVTCRDRGLINVVPLLNASVLPAQAAEAFNLARQRDQHDKVQITLQVDKAFLGRVSTAPGVQAGRGLPR